MEGECGGTGVTNGKGGRTQRGRGPRGAKQMQTWITERAGALRKVLGGPMEEGGCTEQKGWGPHGKGCRKRMGTERKD